MRQQSVSSYDQAYTIFRCNEMLHKQTYKHKQAPRIQHGLERKASD